MLGYDAKPISKAEVSIRARPSGRAMLADAVRHRLEAGFNPRPAIWPGDAASWLLANPKNAFQSAPGHLAGRCRYTRHEWDAYLQFQSAPGHLAGRCNTRPAPCLASFGFNPRPAIWPGDAVRGNFFHHIRRVSIRARPSGRAMLHSRNLWLRKKIFVFSRELARKGQWFNFSVCGFLKSSLLIMLLMPARISRR